MIEFDFDYEKLDRKMRVRIWESGVEIGNSWCAFGDQRQKREQVSKRGTPGSQVVIGLMLLDICERLSMGELIAFGFRTEPTISDGPVYIPADNFSVQHDKNNVEKDMILASGWRYERVSVVQFSEIQMFFNSAETITLPEALTMAKRGGGRRSTYEDAKRTFEALFSEKPHLKTMPASKVLSDFNKLYSDIIHPEDHHVHSISERTLRGHLKRYEQELNQLAKTNFAN